MTLQDYFISSPRLQPLWISDKNPQRPENISPHSHAKAWWRCARGHEWQAQINSVAIEGTCCPYCAGKRAIPGQTDLATTHPHLLPLWSEENTLRPTQVTAGSEKAVWWKCGRGHRWKTKVTVVAVEGCGCPYCAGKLAIPGQTDLATVKPEILEQWDYEKNTKIDPSEILPSAHVKVWWKCPLGHSWEAVVFSRTRENGAGCPYCTGRKVLAGFNDLATRKPKVAKQWHQALNAPLRPEDVTLGCNKKVWWECGDGHIWQATVYSRTRQKGTGCPVCAGKVKDTDWSTVRRK